MPEGTPIDRQWVLVLKNGVVIVDWGNGLAQDLATGDFLRFEERQVSHVAYDEELALLVRQGRILAFDRRLVYLGSLPDLPRKSME